MTAIVATPPSTTAGTSPNHFAVTPDSNSPSSFDAPMNTAFTALTRPRMWSGVSSWMSMWRMNTLTSSAPPSTASATIDSAKFEDSPNTAVAAPNRPTHANSHRPTWRVIGRTTSTIATSVAPTAGAMRNIPSAAGPASSTSFANAGSSAVAPPTSTANRSSVIAPSTIGRERTKCRPSSSVCHVAGPAATLMGGSRTRSMSTTDSASAPATIEYTTFGPARYRKPPSAGPAIVAAWPSVELSATALPNTCGGTRFGVIACDAGIAKARAVPNTAITASTGQICGVASPGNAKRLNHSRPSAHSTSSA